MSQTKTTAKKPTKQQTQAERDKSLIAQGYYDGLEVGRCEGHRAGYSAGQLDETQLCEFLLDHARYKGSEAERHRWTKRSLWQRLRYLINPNHTI